MLLTNQEVIAIFDFNGEQERDLRFKKGDRLRILRSTSDENYYIAELNDLRGIIPIKYVMPLHSFVAVSDADCIYYHKGLSREDSERILLRFGENKSFLVRSSNCFKGDYTLCVLYNKIIEHYRIKKMPDGSLTVDEETFFPNLVDLINKYKHDDFTLCCQLGHGVPVREASSPRNEQQSFIFPIDKSLLPKHLIISSQAVKCGAHIGDGNFSSVFEGVYMGSPVAVKMPNKSHSSRPFMAEVRIMAELKHPNVLRLIGVVVDPKIPANIVSIVTEFCSAGNLLIYLQNRGRNVIPTAQLLKFSMNVALGMRHLEELGVVHRDLAARNILLDESLTAKVSDFGLAFKTVSQVHLTPTNIPLKWTAPEALDDHDKFTTKSDVWSYGVLLWEIYSYGRIPYPRLNHDDVVQFIKSKYRLDAPQDCPERMYRLMTTCWEIEPANRPSFADIVKNVFQL